MLALLRRNCWCKGRRGFLKLSFFFLMILPLSPPPSVWLQGQSRWADCSANIYISHVKSCTKVALLAVLHLPGKQIEAGAECRQQQTPAVIGFIDGGQERKNGGERGGRKQGGTQFDGLGDDECTGLAMWSGFLIHTVGLSLIECVCFQWLSVAVSSSDPERILLSLNHKHSLLIRLCTLATGLTPFEIT